MHRSHQWRGGCWTHTKTWKIQPAFWLTTHNAAVLFHVKSPINDDDALSFHQIPGQFLESLLVVVANVDLRKKSMSKVARKSSSSTLSSWLSSASCKQLTISSLIVERPRPQRGFYQQPIFKNKLILIRREPYFENRSNYAGPKSDLFWLGRVCDF